MSDRAGAAAIAARTRYGGDNDPIPYAEFVIGIKVSRLRGRKGGNVRMCGGGARCDNEKAEPKKSLARVKGWLFDLNVARTCEKMKVQHFFPPFAFYRFRIDNSCL